MIKNLYNIATALIHTSRCVMTLLDLYGCNSEERHASLYRIYHFADEHKYVSKVDRDFYDKVCEFAEYERDLACWHISEDYTVEIAIKVMLSLLYDFESFCRDEPFENER